LVREGSPRIFASGSEIPARGPGHREAEWARPEADFYTAQPIQIEVTGSYDSLGQFFSRLGFFSRIVSVTEVEVKQAEDSGQEVGRSINGSFVVTAYYIAPENLEKLIMTKPVPPPVTPAAPAAPAKK